MNEDERIMPPGTRWIAVVWGLQILSIFLFSAYIDMSWGVVPGYITLLSSLFLTQEAILKKMIRHSKRNRRPDDDEML